MADLGGDFVMAEAGADVEGHALLRPRIESFYAHAVTGSTVRHRIALTRVQAEVSQ